MKNLQQAFWGIMIALVSIGLVFGSLSLSLAEGNRTTVPSSTLLPTSSTLLPTSSTLPPTSSTTLPPTSSPTWQPFTPPANSPTPLPPTWTPTFPPPPTNCPPPAGWLPYIVQPGDTLGKLATYYRVSSAMLGQANCLLTTDLLPGVILYVPPVPTQTSVPCGSPLTWIIYIVQSGDTLYHLSQAYGITVADLQRANCMGGSTLLHPGQSLYVPPWATRTPSPTITGTATATGTPTNTPTKTPTTPVVPSGTSTATWTSTPTATSTPIPSDTPADTPTDTPIETPTPSPTPTNP